MTLESRIRKMRVIIHDLIEYGFKVYYVPNTTYCYYVNNDYIGYTQVDDLCLQTVSSVRKPDRLYGTGTRVDYKKSYKKADYMSAFNYHFEKMSNDVWFKSEKEWISQAYRAKQMLVFMKGE